MNNENKNAEQFDEDNGSKKISRSVFEWLEEFVIAVSVIVILLSFIVRIVTVSGSSMEPNYYHNDRLIITAHGGEIKEGDVIVVVDALNEPIIKRVVATEGQTVDLDPETGIVYVNGVARDESKYGIENGITFIHPNALDPLEFPLTVPENHIFVLGDNREVSNDSRYGEIGLIDERKVLGKAIFNIYPFDKIGLAK
ncbi:MAG: signal peptidase I [Ruminococcaceae bacterium]|nr:signal peptidase I [Oscillospiraceae bacterium]